MRWGSSNGSVEIAGCRLFGKARLGSWGGRVTRYVGKQQERTEMRWWAFAVVCLVKQPPFSDYWKKEPPVHTPWSLQDAWTSPVLAERQHSSTQAAREVSGARRQQPPDTGTEDPRRRSLCWTWSLLARRIGSGKRRFEAASGEAFAYFKHKPAKNSKFQGSNHLLKVRCMLKSFPGSGPLLAISIYAGTNPCQIGYNASKEQTASWTLHIHYCALTWRSIHNYSVCFKRCAMFHVNTINQRQVEQRIMSYLLIESRRI